MNTQADGPTQITFTERGEAALEELAAAIAARLTANTAQDPEAIAAVLEKVVWTDIDDLAAAVTAVDAQSAAREPARLGLTDGEVAVGRDAHEVEWETVRAPMIHPGDLTPAGQVEGVEFHSGIRRVDLNIDGVAYSRSFDDRVDRVRTPRDHEPDPMADPKRDFGLDTQSAQAPDEVARRRRGRSSEPTSPAATWRSAPGPTP